MNYEKKIKRVKGIKISCYEIQTDSGYITVYPCHDAEMFSDEALRQLLLSEDAKQITASVAISVENGKITIKLARL